MALNSNNSAYKERNLEFLQEYASRPGVKSLYGGVLYREITKGRGEKPTARSVVTVHYKGMLINGKPFDATEKGRPATFPLRGLIEGWKIALKEMNVGARWEVVIPFNLGYGARGAGAIKPFSTLIFDIQLLRVE
ncbi:MAG: FKBP-type peptidyl-prolyl cis-trans isomerase [Tidjanibacter sp.]|nr:FKBP-type peptidyl-prolyl cis-trans isomerase [Tidjanibacter sp.]